jgi:hypothetical protein
MQDQWGNTIIITVSTGGSPWTFTRSLDGIIVQIDASKSQAQAQAFALNALNAMCPAADVSQLVVPGDFNSFINALLTDPQVTSALFQNASPFVVAAAKLYIISPALVKAYWTALLASPPAWLTAAVQTKITGYAQQYNIAFS